ncbi:MAG: hypothetical protein JJE04_12420, partial [Acidobacteriia bacterium]|nr:hypothetical protein [Terriglobia bacterium]
MKIINTTQTFLLRWLLERITRNLHPQSRLDPRNQPTNSSGSPGDDPRYPLLLAALATPAMAACNYFYTSNFTTTDPAWTTNYDIAPSSWGFRRRRTLIPEGTRTAFRAEGEQFSERSDAGTSIVPEVFGFVKKN